MSQGKFIDLTGKEYGRIFVICRDGYINGTIAWLCRCKCGNTKRIPGDSLREGNSKSCGCLKSELCRDMADKYRRRNDLNGKRYGRWTVVDRNGSYSNGSWSWNCRCDCGTLRVISSDSLTGKHTRGCGCKRRESLAKLRRSVKFREQVSNGLIRSWASKKTVLINSEMSQLTKEFVNGCIK
jgi:hypothetical protein